LRARAQGPGREDSEGPAEAYAEDPAEAYAEGQGGSNTQRPRVLLVTLGSTEGLRVADEELAESLRRAGAEVTVARAERPREVRTLMLTDLGWARAARRAAKRAIRENAGAQRAVIYSTTTAAMFWPTAGAIRFDAPAAANRPGRHGLWQRPLERRRLREAPLLIPSSEGALEEAEAAVKGCGERAVVVPVPVEGRAPGAPGEREGERNTAAVTYAANPSKKGFDRVVEAWRRARRPGERLVVAGVTREGLRQSGFETADDDIEIAGMLTQNEYRALLRRARVFVCAPRREDYGIAQLEALVEGCKLVTTTAPGPHVALKIARELDPRLVGENLDDAIRCALDTPAADYAERAAKLVEPFSREAVDRIVAEDLLPRLTAEGAEGRA
jgi:glycosyltransferase involved in cell wall biosynthesis